jgi:hypothetical protein
MFRVTFFVSDTRQCQRSWTTTVIKARWGCFVISSPRRRRLSQATDRNLLQLFSHLLNSGGKIAFFSIRIFIIFPRKQRTRQAQQTRYEPKTCNGTELIHSVLQFTNHRLQNSNASKMIFPQFLRVNIGGPRQTGKIRVTKNSGIRYQVEKTRVKFLKRWRQIVFVTACKIYTPSFRLVSVPVHK